MMMTDRKDSYKLNTKNNLVFALEEFDLTFYPDEVKRIKGLWKFGWSVDDIAAQIKRHKYEVAVLLFHLLYTRQIKKRKDGVVVH